MLLYFIIPILYIMRISILLVWFFLLAACTSNNSTTNPISSSTVQSQISSEKYAPELQKTIPSPTYWTGKHNITIYADFQCPACINFSQGIGTLFDSYAEAGMITITYKQFPLTSLHKNAYRDAIAALCAAEQWKYRDAKKALYGLEALKNGASVNDADRIDALSKAWIDSASLTQCLSENRYAKQVDQEVREWDQAGVSGTPTLMLNGTRLDLWVIFADPQKGKEFLDRVLSK
jgi:protein-disulfide isomerase